MKKILIFLITLLFIPSIYALSVEDVPITDYVNDYANVLSPETESYIIEQSKTLYNADGTQIVVVTIPTLDGLAVEDFAHDLGNYYKIGKDSKGLIILLVTEDRKLRVEVGDNLEGILNDAKVGRFMDTYMIPYLGDDDWDNGIRNGYNAFYNEIVNQENLDISITETPQGFEVDHKEDPLLIALMIAFGAALIGGAIGNSVDGLYIGDLISSIFMAAPIYTSAYLGLNIINSFGYCIFPVLLYLIVRFSKGSGGGRSSGGGSSWSSGGGGGSFGGGGHFSGGGASRGF